MPQAKPPYVVVGYLATTYNQSTRSIYPLTLSNLPWNDITHLYEAFGVPSATGTITFNPASTYTNLVSTAHTNSTRVYLSCGGEGVSDSTWYQATTGTTLTTLVNNIMADVNAYGFDGVDIDWEFPGEVDSDEANFTNLISALAVTLHAQTAYDGKPKGLTFFISAGAYVCDVNWTAAAHNCGLRHSKRVRLWSGYFGNHL